VVFLQSKRAMFHCGSALLHFAWFFRKADAQRGIAQGFSRERTRNAPLRIVFSESRRAMRHCAGIFQRAHAQWVIADGFSEKQTRSWSNRVIFWGSARSMEHFADRRSRQREKSSRQTEAVPSFSEERGFAQRERNSTQKAQKELKKHKKNGSNSFL